MAKIGLPKGSGKRLKVREKSVKSQGTLKRILSGNPVSPANPGPCSFECAVYCVDLDCFKNQMIWIQML